MTDFATPADIVAALAAAGNGGGGCRQYGVKQQTTSVAGFYYSTWLAAGTNGPGVAPTTWAIPTKATAGSWAPQLVDATGGKTNRLLGLGVVQTSACGLNFHDRLGHMAGLNGTVTTAQTVSGTLDTQAAAGRCAADGSDVQWFFEWYTATGSTAVTLTVSYTNQSGTAGRTCTVAIPASVPAGRQYPIVNLQAGDTSIQSIQTVTQSASTLTVGNYGVTAVKFLASQFSLWNNNQGTDLDWANLKLPLIGPGACISANAWATGTTVGANMYSIVVGAA